jgi:hypothetical protein
MLASWQFTNGVKTGKSMVELSRGQRRTAKIDKV